MLFFCPELELELDYWWSWKRSHPKASFAFLGYSWQLSAIEFKNSLRLSFSLYFVVVVLAGLRAYCYCSSWSSGLCECVHFLQLTTAAAASSTVHSSSSRVQVDFDGDDFSLRCRKGKKRALQALCLLLQALCLFQLLQRFTTSKLAQLPRPPKHPREQPSMVEPSKRLGTHQTTPRPSF